MTIIRKKTTVGFLDLPDSLVFQTPAAGLSPEISSNSTNWRGDPKPDHTCVYVVLGWRAVLPCSSFMMAMVTGNPATRILVYHNRHWDEDRLKTRFVGCESGKMGITPAMHHPIATCPISRRCNRTRLTVLGVENPDQYRAIFS